MMVISGERYITEKEVASFYGRSIKWIRKIRYSDNNFPYYKLNGRVFFKDVEVEQWFKQNMKPVQ